MSQKISFFLYVMCLSAFQPIHAQTLFAPPGAEWYHDMTFGVFHSTVSADTVIKGISCREIGIRPEIRNPAQSPPVHGYRLYVYNNADTVFIYNYLFDRFTPLYVFNVQQGDTVNLPALPPSGGEFLYDPADRGFTDSSFCFIVDSVGIKTWDNEPLKTVYTHHWNRNNPSDTTYYPDYTYGDTTGAYAERLGSIETGFLPRCLTCGTWLDDSEMPVGPLRCYTDTQDNAVFSVKRVDTCDKGISTGISALPDTDAGFSVSPNPAFRVLTVSFATPLPEGGQWTLTDITGRKAAGGLIGKGIGKINVRLPLLSRGMYFLNITTPAHGRMSRKICIAGR